MTLTKRCRARLNGTSSASRRASRSPAGTGASTTRSVARACSPRYARIARGCGRSLRWATSASGTHGSTSTQLLAGLAAQKQKQQIKAVKQAAAKAQTKDSLKAFAKLTHEVDGEPRIISDPPLIVPIHELAGDEDREAITAELMELFRGYRRSLQPDRRTLLEGYRFADLARKVVGVGSVGTRCWIMLLLGRDNGDPLFLQIKETGPSALESVLGRSQYRNHGQRVVEGQRLMQAASDIFLGWIHVKAGLDGAAARLLRPAALGLEDLGRPRHDPAAGPRALRGSLRRNARARSCPLGRSHRDRRRISARTTSSIARSRSSRSRTQIRTSATTTLSCKPPVTAGSRPRRASSPAWWNLPLVRVGPWSSAHSASSWRCKPCSSSHTSARCTRRHRATCRSAVVGPPALVDAVGTRFSLRTIRYTDEAAAKGAIDRRQAYGALVTTPSGLKLVVAPAAGNAVATALTTAFTTAAAAGGRQLDGGAGASAPRAAIAAARCRSSS